MNPFLDKKTKLSEDQKPIPRQKDQVKWGPGTHS